MWCEDFFRGTVMLLRGLKLYGTNPRLILLGLLPALIAGVLFAGLYVALIVFVDDLADAGDLVRRRLVELARHRARARRARLARRRRRCSPC